MECSIAAIAQDFPQTCIGFILASGLSVRPARSAALQQQIDAATADANDILAGQPLAEIPQIQVWRQAYKAFGVKKTSYRSSVERLLRSVAAGRDFPQVNNLVDSYNLVSLRYLLPVGADDCDHLQGGVCFRRAAAGDDFYALGSKELHDDPPKAGEVVYADDAKILCRRWNWYQDQRSAISETTTCAVLTVQGCGAGNVAAAVTELRGFLEEFCQARSNAAITSADQPVVQLNLP